jgi:hypothetical protein
MSAVPRGPAEEGVDHWGIPPAGVTVGEPVTPSLVGDVDQTHRDPVQQRDGRAARTSPSGDCPVSRRSIPRL